MRGVVEVAFLEAIEAEYQRRHGPGTRLCDVFDLVGGTSTGALVAAAVALGLPMAEVSDFYLHRARRTFSRRRLWRYILPVFRAEELEHEIVRVVGDIAMDDPAIRTLLAIVMKRLDTGSPWIVSNLPDAPFWDEPGDGRFHGNRTYRLARLLMASTAAPTFFQQQQIRIGPDEPGVFVDGGASPHNDPSLALLMLARLKPFGLEWPTGPDRLSVLSIGTGHFRRKADPARLAASGPLTVAYSALRGLIADNESLIQVMMQGLGTSRRPVWLNAELGALADGGLTGAPILDYLRLDLPLDERTVAEFDPVGEGPTLARLREITDPGIIAPLYAMARAYCARTYDLASLLP